MSMRDLPNLYHVHVAQLRDARPIAGGHKHETNQTYMMSVCEAYHFHAVMVHVHASSK